MKGAEIRALSLVDVRDAIARGDLTSEAVTLAAVEQARELAPRFGVFITTQYDEAMAAATAADQQRASGIRMGSLHGVPITVKDNIDTAGTRTTAGALVHADRVPAEDAHVVARLKTSGAISLGKTNMHEMALGGTSDNPHFGPVRNPWAPDLIPGGSSGGSAAAVSLQIGYASLGTDSAGSVRMPAHFCGQVGFKQTHGSVSLRGCMPTGTGHTDHIGVHARSVADARAMFDVMRGYDAADPHSSPHELVPFDGPAPIEGLRIGIPQTYFWEALDPAVEPVCRRALASLEAAGASFVPVTFETAAVIKLTRAAGMAEAFVYHEPYLRENPAAYGGDIRPRLLAGQFVLAHDYVRALRVRRLVAEEMTKVLSAVDVLAMPTVPVPAYPIPSLTGGAGMPRDPMLALRNTMVFNQTGHPAISLPAGLTEAGLPVGLQLAASAFEDFRLLGVAQAVEAVLKFSPVPPVIAEAGVPA